MLLTVVFPVPFWQLLLSFLRCHLSTVLATFFILLFHVLGCQADFSSASLFFQRTHSLVVSFSFTGKLSHFSPLRESPSTLLLQPNQILSSACLLWVFWSPFRLLFFQMCQRIKVLENPFYTIHLEAVLFQGRLLFHLDWYCLNWWAVAHPEFQTRF